MGEDTEDNATKQGHTQIGGLIGPTTGGAGGAASAQANAPVANVPAAHAPSSSISTQESLPSQGEGYEADDDSVSTQAHPDEGELQQMDVNEDAGCASVDENVGIPVHEEDASATRDAEEDENLQDHGAETSAGHEDYNQGVVNVPSEGTRRSTRSRQPSVRSKDMVFHDAMYEEEIELTDDPRSLAEVKKRADWPQWQAAMQSEINSLLENGTYELVDLPPGVKPIPSKWVYKVKRDEAGRLDKHKARVVAKGFKQIAGRDYHEVYAPVSRHSTLRILLALIIQKGLAMRQLDIRTAFLHGALEETVYLTPPPGYSGHGKVWLLKKALYGLKQSARAWYLHLKDILTGFNMKISYSDESLYILEVDVKKGYRVYILVYVDDLLVAGSQQSVDALVDLIGQKLDMRDMGEPKHFLGMEMIRDIKNGTLWLGQQQNAKGILEKFGMTDAKPRKTPMDANLPLKKFEGIAEPQVLEPYQSLVGSLLYLANCTRPDLAQPVGLLARFMSNPATEHLTAAKQVLKYLAGTTELGLLYKANASGLTGYCDADYAGDLDKRKSTSGFVFIINGAAVSWCSKLQPTVALSTCEAEFISAANAAKEALWIRNLRAEMTGRVEEVMIKVDNQGALKLLGHPHAHQRTKHIDVAHRFVQERVERGELKFEYIQTNEMVADCTTKVVPLKKLQENCRDMGLCKRSSIAKS